MSRTDVTAVAGSSLPFASHPRGRLGHWCISLCFGPEAAWCFHPFSFGGGRICFGAIWMCQRIFIMHVPGRFGPEAAYLSAPHPHISTWARIFTPASLSRALPVTGTREALHSQRTGLESAHGVMSATWPNQGYLWSLDVESPLV